MVLSNVHRATTLLILSLSFMNNDTDNVIEFNDGISNKIDETKPRSFWNLLKFK